MEIISLSTLSFPELESHLKTPPKLNLKILLYYLKYFGCILVVGVFRYYCTVCGKGQPGPKKFLQHMLKQHNVENAEIPRPFEDAAPEPLIQQHKAVVEAETAARLARAASNLKKEKVIL